MLATSQMTTGEPLLLATLKPAGIAGLRGRPCLAADVWSPWGRKFETIAWPDDGGDVLNRVVRVPIDALARGVAVKLDPSRAVELARVVFEHEKAVRRWLMARERDEAPATGWSPPVPARRMSRPRRPRPAAPPPRPVVEAKTPGRAGRGPTSLAEWDRARSREMLAEHPGVFADRRPG